MLKVHAPRSDTRYDVLAPVRLTPRQNEVFSLLAVGYLHKEIAHKLDMSQKTVEAHVRTAMANNTAATTTALCVRAAHQGVINLQQHVQP